MTRDGDMHRSSDEGAGPASERSFITIDRKIPLPWLLGSLGALGLVLTGMFFQQRATSEKVSDVGSDVRQIRAEMQAQNKQSMEDNFMIRDIGRRLTAVELDVRALQLLHQQPRQPQELRQ